MTSTPEERAIAPRAGIRVRSSVINLVNLLLRETANKVSIVQVDAKLEVDPELFVVTRLDWRDADRTSPVLHQLPRILSILETLRGCRGVPTEVHLDSTDGITAYLPTGKRLSAIPDNSKEAVGLLLGLVKSTVLHTVTTVKELEEYFWGAARQKGFSPEIVERIARKEKYFDSQEQESRYYQLLHRFFSIRFRIHTAESCLHMEV